MITITSYSTKLIDAIADGHTLSDDSIAVVYRVFEYGYCISKLYVGCRSSSNSNEGEFVFRLEASQQTTPSTKQKLY